MNEIVPKSQYVSIFERFSDFEELWRMAKLLSESLFVPQQNFRGNPANCLVGIDLAMSLGIKPTSIFPHLYIIDGRPALSSQFVIALVNRSGQFSRIRWREGVDGEVSFEAYGKTRTVPNCWAEASFTELSSGEAFASTRVDLRLALQSGWLTKNGSKWQTLPREMCRWRSAAWLAKNYCPETILGIEFAEELDDARVLRPVEIEQEPVRSEPDEEQALSERIASAATVDELKALGADVASSTLGKDAKGRLRAAYGDRLKELSPKKAASKKAAKSDAILDGIAAAQDEESLDAIATALESQECGEEYLRRMTSLIDARRVEVRASLTVARAYSEQLRTAKERDEVDRIAALAADELERGKMLSSHFDELNRFAEDCKERLTA